MSFLDFAREVETGKRIPRQNHAFIGREVDLKNTGYIEINGEMVEIHSSNRTFDLVQGEIAEEFIDRNFNFIKKDLHISQTITYGEFANMIRDLLSDAGYEVFESVKATQIVGEFIYEISDKITFYGLRLEIGYQGNQNNQFMPLPKNLEKFLESDKWWNVIINWLKMMIAFNVEGQGENSEKLIEKLEE